MTEAEPTLRKWLQSPYRPLIVITVTLVVALVTIWPAADEYSAIRGYRSELMQSIRSAQSQVDQLEALEELATSLGESLAEFEAQGMDDDAAHQFRRGLVELARRSGCRLRQIRSENARRRVWHENDDPLSTKTGGQQGSETDFLLRSQLVSLSVSGPLSGIQEILTELRGKRKLIHTRRLCLRPRGDQQGEIVLDIEFLLLNLERRSKVAAA